MAFGEQDLRQLLRLLAEDPQARDELSRLLAPEEIRLLGAEVRALANEVRALGARVDALAAAQVRTEERLEALVERVDALAAAQVRTEERLEELAARMAELSYQVDELRGESVERRYRERGHSYFSVIARRLRPLSLDDLDGVLDAAVAERQLTDEEAEEVRLADAILRGRRRADGAEVYLVVEASSAVDEGDVERAARRASLLASTGLLTVPVVAGRRFTAAGEEEARRTGVWRFTDGRSEPPESEAG